jgi:tripartite-type tricarboxylate transporter receptor subunit TctC
MIDRRVLLAALAGLAAGLPAGHAQAQSYPTRIIRIIVPFTPGSPNDVMARLISPPLSAALGQPIVIENRPGAGTTIGSKAAAGAEPDGYTLLFSSANLVLAPALYKNLTFDPIRDFTPVARLGSSSWVLVVTPQMPIRSMQELAAYAKANPAALKFGYGLGTSPHLLGEMLRVLTGTDIQTVPYRGGAQAVTDILGGHIHLNFGTPSTILSLIRDGKLRPLAVTSPERNPDLPDVPTMTEAGLPGLTLSFWTGLVAPAGTPVEIVERLNREINELLKSKELQASMAKLGFEATPSSRQAYAAFSDEEMRKWQAIVEATGVKPAD